MGRTWNEASVFYSTTTEGIYKFQVTVCVECTKCFLPDGCKSDFVETSFNEVTQVYN